MDSELTLLKNGNGKTDEDILKIIDIYKTIEDWREISLKGLLKFINVVFETSCLFILEDMLLKGLRFNPIFKTKESKFVLRAIYKLDYKLFDLLNTFEFDQVVELHFKTTLDYFANLSTLKKYKNIISSKKILKSILKQPKIFQNSTAEGIDVITSSLPDPHILSRMILKKFKDPSIIWNEVYFFDYLGWFSIPTYKYIFEKSTHLKTNKVLQKKLLEKLYAKRKIWTKGRNKKYKVRCLLLSMLRFKIN